jgi:hypothetical protein
MVTYFFTTPLTAGPSGASVREVVRLSGAEINSWTEAAGSHRGRRPARIFVIKVRGTCNASYITGTCNCSRDAQVLYAVFSRNFSTRWTWLAECLRMRGALSQAAWHLKH